MLTPQEKAVDDMVAMIKEDLIHVEPGATNASLAPSLVTPLYDRYLNVLENDGYVPASGFVNGRAFPSGADLAVLVFLKSGFPFGAALKNAKQLTSAYSRSNSRSILDSDEALVAMPRRNLDYWDEAAACFADAHCPCSSVPSDFCGRQAAWLHLHGQRAPLVGI